MKLPSSGTVLALVTLFYAVGVLGHAIPVLLPLMLALTPWFLLASGVVILGTYVRSTPARPLVLWFVPVFLVTFGLEVLGVATGWVFGPYHYQTTLGSLLWGVPPVIGLNWVVVVLGVHLGLRWLLPSASPWVRVGLVAVACVGFDWLLEPVAIALGYWVWHGPTIPLQNYLAWGLIAAAGGWWAERFPLTPHWLLGGYVVLQASFFLTLRLLGIHL